MLKVLTDFGAVDDDINIVTVATSDFICAGDVNKEPIDSHSD